MLEMRRLLKVANKYFRKLNIYWAVAGILFELSM